MTFGSVVAHPGPLSGAVHAHARALSRLGRPHLYRVLTADMTAVAYSAGRPGTLPPVGGCTISRRLRAEGAVAWVFQAGPDRWMITEYLEDAQRQNDLRDTVWTIGPATYAWSSPVSVDTGWLGDLQFF